MERDLLDPLDLSERERQVVRLIALGRSNQEIGDDLFIGINTVKTYIRTAYRKIGADSRAQAIVWAFRTGFVSVDDFDGLHHDVRHRSDTQDVVHD